ncbi:hypothetical protein KUTeg_022590 [Tegillarca granosa]|uniref:Ubiquitin-activating enzyme E1 C-terminal domain-containing protein n=1 Tax=Tegillarca granosa TaxID=220873 RepID=A0ABQ9E309_TEGGR|nr:hypothetical protein KUTeg_022590 [Tegillarca granosa]
MATEVEIDDSLYSRQRYVLGDSAMKRMASSSVLIYGMGGLGIEIAKNLALAGIKVANVEDLGTQFFLREDDVKSGKNRAEACSGLLSELNPYVSINTLTSTLNMETDLSYMTQYQCIILTEMPLNVMVRVNNFCRSQKPQIKFISADVYGLYCDAFCDFGDQFEVTDSNGEEAKDIFIENISKENPGIVTCLKDRIHGLETGDVVQFKEIHGMTALNGKMCKINVLTPNSFSICDTSGDEFKPYEHGGIVSQIKVPQTFSYKSLDTQLINPDILTVDFSKIEVETIDSDIIQGLSYTCRGCFPPLCATIGGFVAQEGLKALTGKFMPLNQNDRYDHLRICVGENKINKLANMRLFMVGCGAIGCEMLKNYALLGVSSQGKGQITITDNDLIEKSNLNRQFLFRPQHIRQPKSTTAVQSVLQINPSLKIEAQQHKVCPQTEDKIYNDAFFESQNLIVNALDNVEARRYVDSRCVTNQRPLLESGTMGTKGHVQVIVPHITESYTSQMDPVDEDVPYCTLKSFPATIEHCIQWAREKFESSFAQKPNNFNKFWSVNGVQPENKLNQGEAVEGAIQVSKLMQNKPKDWCNCVRMARLKFEKYFNHKAKQLLHSFPEDTKLKDGSLFWQSPKRMPTPIGHLLFIASTARLYADANRVSWNTQDQSAEAIKQILQSVTVPEFIPSSKRIETDESAKKESQAVNPSSGDELVDSANRIQSSLQSNQLSQVLEAMQVAEFEKDDDSNGHIDFITSAANLRGQMYSIENADRLKVKKIAGRIVPAIATTTAAVAGLVSIELLKLTDRLPIEKYKNCFLNLALPVIEGLSFTMWDRWEVHGNKDFKLQEFLHYFKDTYGFEATMVSHGVKMVFVPFMPGHMKRLPFTIVH